MCLLQRFKTQFVRSRILCCLFAVIQHAKGYSQQQPVYSGLLKDTSITVSETGQSTSIRVYLPAGYASARKSYPVIYVPGMRNFDKDGAWLIIQCLDSLARQRPAEMIVVGFDLLQTGSPNEKAAAYLTAGWENQQQLLLAKTLKPFIDAHYRTQPGPASSLLAGADSGALIAYHLLLKQPELFGKGAVFSPPFLLLPESEGDAAPGHNGKFFFYWATQDLPDEMSNLHYIDQHLGNAPATMIFVAEDETGDNTPSSWSRWLPDAINWLLADGFNYVMGK